MGSVRCFLAIVFGLFLFVLMFLAVSFLGNLSRDSIDEPLGGAGVFFLNHGDRLGIYNMNIVDRCKELHIWINYDKLHWVINLK